MHPPTRHRQFSPTKLRELRRAAGISARQLARELEVMPGHPSGHQSEWATGDYELGRRTPPTKLLPLLADRFGVPIDDLFEDA